MPDTERNQTNDHSHSPDEIYVRRSRLYSRVPHMEYGLMEYPSFGIGFGLLPLWEAENIPYSGPRGDIPSDGQ
jgi:hypothetical protein